MKKNLSIFFFLIFFLSFNCLLADSSNLNFPEHIKLKGTSLILNGQGFRKATIFRVKVFSMALYLEKRESNPDEILKSRKTKFIKVRILRGITAKQLVKAWTQGVNDNYPDYMLVQKELQMYNNAMMPVKKGDEFTLTFQNDILELALNSKYYLKIKSRKFQEALLSVWLGKKPLSRKLKEDLLIVK